jgi:hypothetical protein
MPRKYKALNWENLEKLTQFAAQLASLYELLRKAS